MRVLALYDIHGNVDALDAVLADPAAAGADAVVVGGDALPGPFPGETLARLRALPSAVHHVRGNGEREIAAAAQAGVDPSGVPAEDPLRHTAALNAAALGGDVAAALGALPLTIVLDGVLYCHATPRSDDEILTRISPPERWNAALADAGADVVIAGHTHQQHDRRVDVTRFLNAGSVGLPYEGDAAARWAWIDDGAPSLHRTPYDAVAAGRRMLASGWPDAESVEAALLHPEDAMVVTRLFEGRA